MFARGHVPSAPIATLAAIGVSTTLSVGSSSLVMIQNVYAHLTPSDAYDALLKVLSET